MCILSGHINLFRCHENAGVFRINPFLLDRALLGQYPYCMRQCNCITACTLDCPDACSLIVSRDNDGRARIRGNPDHPITRGFTCPKMSVHVKRLTSRDRITHPLIRSGAGWERIEWVKALDLCRDKFQEYRREPASILYFHGEGAKGALKQGGAKVITISPGGDLGASHSDIMICIRPGTERQYVNVFDLHTWEVSRLYLPHVKKRMHAVAALMKITDG